MAKAFHKDPARRWPTGLRRKASEQQPTALANEDITFGIVTRTSASGHEQAADTFTGSFEAIMNLDI